MRSCSNSVSSTHQPHVRYGSRRLLLCFEKCLKKVCLGAFMYTFVFLRREKAQNLHASGTRFPRAKNIRNARSVSGNKIHFFSTCVGRALIPFSTLFFYLTRHPLVNHNADHRPLQRHHGQSKMGFSTPPWKSRYSSRWTRAKHGARHDEKQSRPHHSSGGRS